MSEGGPAATHGPRAAGPNHELVLVMTKERAGVVAEASVLPLACSV
jgi:hypothetical protein